MSPLSTKFGGRYGKYFPLVSRVVDLLSANLGFWLTTSLIHDSDGVGLDTRSVWIIFNLVLFLVLMWIGRKGYNRSVTVERLLSLSTREVALHAMIFVPVLYFMQIDDINWRQFLLLYVWMLGLLGFERVLVNQLVKVARRRGRNISAVAIVGSGPQAVRLYKSMNSLDGFGYRVKALFGPEPPEGSILREVYKGPAEELDQYMNCSHIDEVYYCSSTPVPSEITTVARACEARMIQFYFVPQIPAQVLGSFHVSSLGQIPVLTLKDTPLRSIFNRATKRAFDLAFSSVALICSPIIFVPVAIAIKCSSPGPIFFKQKRTGLKGKEFDCYKFRTMRVNASADTQQATRDDPRKTKVGDFLRKTSLDELPQFINVWLGDMSIVGPRPHMLRHTEEYAKLIKQYMVRHAVKPGITGWAQVNGFRGQTEELWQMEGRVQHDIWYIEHWSFLLDLKIMLQTIFNAVKGEDNAF